MKIAIFCLLNAIIWGAAAGFFGVWALIPVALAYGVGIVQGHMT